METTPHSNDRDLRETSRQLMTTFIRLANKYRAMEKFPMQFGTDFPFHHSERHMLDLIEEHPDLNITDLAARAGVTKGAISQIVGKLEKKGAVKRYKDIDDRQVRVRLTGLGRAITEHVRRVNQDTVDQLLEVIRDRPREHVDFLVAFFGWIEEHLDDGLRRMQTRHRE